MKTIALIAVLLSVFTLNSLAQIQMESLDLEAPCITSKNKVLFSKSGPLMIVKIDSIEIELDSISSNNLDKDWIQSITVLKDSKATERYGCKGENGAIIIRLKEEHNDDFIKEKKATKPIKIKKVS